MSMKSIPLSIIHFCVILQTALLVVSTSSQSQPLLVPTCNSRLEGRKITVYGLRWDAINIRLSNRVSKITECPGRESSVEFELLDHSTLQKRHEIVKSVETNAELEMSANIIYFNKDGSLAVVIGDEHHYFGKEEFCIMKLTNFLINIESSRYYVNEAYNSMYEISIFFVDNSTNNKLMNIKYCKPSCKGNRPCIPKCCPYGESFNPLEEVCETTQDNVKWSPFLYHDEHSTKPSNKSKFFPHYVYFLLQPRCHPTSSLDPFYSRTIAIDLPNSEKYYHWKFPFKILEDGSLAFITNSRKWEKQPKNDEEHYCIDAIQNYDPKIKSRGLEDEQIVFNCGLKTSESNISAVYMVSMYMAAIFLLLTCIVYLLLWDKQNVHGWTVFSLVLSMFFWFIFMGTSHLLGLLSGSGVPFVSEEEQILANFSSFSPPEPSSPTHLSLIEEHFNESNVKERSNELLYSESEEGADANIFCTFNAVLAHFFFLSTFTWLTFINLDLCLTFKTISSITGRSKGFKKFFSYASLSWGLPLIVVIIGLTLDHQYPNRESLVLTPEYGKAYCFVAPWAQGVYIYFIITVMLVLNFIFVGTTFYFLYSVKKLAGSVRSNKTNKKQETFVLVAKLSVVMGVTWIFEVISWATTKDQNHTAWYWVAIDMYNLFQAVLIFIIFVCKRTIMNQLEQKYPIFRDIFNACGCTKLISVLSTIRKSPGISGTEASMGNTQSTDSDSNWNKNGAVLNSFRNENNSYANDSDCDEKFPNLKSFEKSDSNTLLLPKGSDK